MLGLMSRYGDDLVRAPSGLTMDGCAEACCANAACVSWLWASSPPQAYNAWCTAGKACCFLKNGPGWYDNDGGVCGDGCESWSGLSGRPTPDLPRLRLHQTAPLRH